jgi:hypothetical protein
MFSKYGSAMDTCWHVLVDFTIVALYVNQRTNKITDNSNVCSIHHENGKYLSTIVAIVIIIIIIIIIDFHRPISSYSNPSPHSLCSIVNETKWSSYFSYFSSVYNYINNYSLVDKLWSIERHLFFRSTLCFLVISISCHCTWSH